MRAYRGDQISFPDSIHAFATAEKLLVASASAFRLVSLRTSLGSFPAARSAFSLHLPTGEHRQAIAPDKGRPKEALLALKAVRQTPVFLSRCEDEQAAAICPLDGLAVGLVEFIGEFHTLTDALVRSGMLWN